MTAEFIEKLAELEHEQWMSWVKAIWNEISAERRARWTPMLIPYEDLSDDAKEQDREWARKVLGAVRFNR
jgi:RyR domain